MGEAVLSSGLRGQKVRVDVVWEGCDLPPAQSEFVFLAWSHPSELLLWVISDDRMTRSSSRNALVALKRRVFGS